MSHELAHRQLRMKPRKLHPSCTSFLRRALYDPNLLWPTCPTPYQTHLLSTKPYPLPLLKQLPIKQPTSLPLRPLLDPSVYKHKYATSFSQNPDNYAARLFLSSSTKVSTSVGMV